MVLTLANRHNIREHGELLIWKLEVHGSEATILQWYDTGQCYVYRKGASIDGVDVQGFLAAQTKALEMIGN